MKERTMILVVGGAGFIGSHVNKMLHRAGYETVVLDNLSRGHRDAVKYGTFIEGDLSDTSLLNQIFDRYPIRAVMHFAAYINVGESVNDPAKYYINNVTYTLNLLNAMIQHEVKYFIFSSTAAIFGTPREPLIGEDHPCQPINPYGETKWMVERMLRDFDSAYGLKFCCLRYFNAAGGDPEGEIKNYQIDIHHLIPRILFSSVKAEGFITINGTDYPTYDGTCIRDYIHVEDLGTAHITAMEQLLGGASSNCYNLGNGQGFSIYEVIKTVEKTLGRKIKIVEGPRRIGDPACLLANPQKATKELNWAPKFTLESMIEHAWNSYPELFLLQANTNPEK